MRYSYFLITIIVLFNGCWYENKPGSIQVYFKQNDSTDFDFKAIHFINNDTGFIAGSEDYVQHNEHGVYFATLHKKAIVFVTFDGGLNWSKSELGDGYISNLIYINKCLFLINNDSAFKPSGIYSTRDYGKTWVKSPVPNGIITPFSYKADLFVLTRTKDSISEIKGLKDTVWSKYATCNFSAGDNVVSKNHLYVHQYIDNRNILHDYNMETNLSISDTLEGKYKYYFLTVRDENPVLFGVENNLITCYAYNELGERKLFEVKTDELGAFPESYYSSGGKEVLIIGARSNSGIVYKLLYKNTADSGWKTVALRNQNLISPYCFFKGEDNRLYGVFNAGSGKLETVKF